MTFLASPHEQEIKRQQSSKLFQDENVQIHLVSDLRVFQVGDVSCRFLLQMEDRVYQSTGHLVRRQLRVFRNFQSLLHAFRAHLYLLVFELNYLLRLVHSEKLLSYVKHFPCAFGHKEVQKICKQGQNLDRVAILGRGLKMLKETVYVDTYAFLFLYSPFSPPFFLKRP